MPREQLQALLSALKANPPSAEQASLLHTTLPHLSPLSAQSKQVLREELLIQSVVQSMKAATYQSRGIALSLINRVQALAQAPEKLGAEGLKTAFPRPFILVAHMQELQNSELQPLLPRLAQALDGLRDQVKLQPISLTTYSDGLPPWPMKNWKPTALWKPISKPKSRPKGNVWKASVRPS